MGCDSKYILYSFINPKPFARKYINYYINLYSLHKPPLQYLSFKKI